MGRSNILDPNNLPPKNKVPAAAIDLTRQRFYNYQVLYYTFSKNWNPYWVCKCDCGNYFLRDKKSITRKDKICYSCGCYSKLRASETHRNQLVGQKFNKLTVIEDTKRSDKSGQSIWKCQCECGNITYVTSTNLKSGSTKSCGCLGSSSGEYEIEQILKQYEIQYKKEYEFSDLKYIMPLRFDFAIFKNNQLKYLIEYQGIQHKINAFKKPENEFKIDLYRDQLKRDYCQQHNIQLFEIWYYENLQEALLKILNAKGENA